MLSPAFHIDRQRAQKNVLRVVASLEWTKGIFAFLLGVVALLLVHQDAWVIAESVLALLHISTDRRSAQLFLEFADSLTEARLWDAATLAFVYSGLRFAEGYGLWKQRTWAEWFAFGSGMLLLPIEIRELFRGVTALRSAVFVINVAIVIYMFFLLRAERRSRHERQQHPAKAPDRGGS
jgi:uncharacterized membrane protein (DUF2068 family)